MLIESFPADEDADADADEGYIFHVESAQFHELKVRSQQQADDPHHATGCRELTRSTHTLKQQRHRYLPPYKVTMKPASTPLPTMYPRVQTLRSVPRIK